MSNLFKELTKEAENQQKFLQKQQESPTDAAMPDTDAAMPDTDAAMPDTDAAMPDTDAAMPDTDAGSQHQVKTLDHEKLKIIISELSALNVYGNSTSVRLSKTERQDIQDFVHITLRKNGIDGKSVSGAKLMRYALRYMIKVHKEEFIDALSEVLKENNSLSI